MSIYQTITLSNLRNSFQKNPVNISTEKFLASKWKEKIYANENIYDKRLLKIIYNSLLIMDDENTSEKQSALYLNGLLEMLQPTNENIRKWIREKLTC